MSNYNEVLDVRRFYFYVTFFAQPQGIKRDNFPLEMISV